MEPKQLAARPRTDLSYVATPTLISAVARTGDRPNVRLMEELLARGPGWEPGVVAALNLALSSGTGDRDPPPNPLWLAVVAGVMRAAGAVPGLLRMLRAVQDVATGAERIREEATKLVGLEALTKRARGEAGRPSLN
jgi:hypothetical protein